MAGTSITATSAVVPAGAQTATAQSSGGLDAHYGAGPTFCGGFPNGHVLSAAASLDNVYACGPAGPNLFPVPHFEIASWAFQCVEYANRFLWDEFGLQPISGTSLVGGNFVTTFHAAHPSIGMGTSGSTALPDVGDVVSMWGGTSGQSADGSLSHVAVVSKVSGTQATGWTISLVEENDPPSNTGVASISVSGDGKAWSYGKKYFTTFQWLQLKPDIQGAPPVDRNAVKNTVASVPGGASYAIDGNSTPHWIPDVESYYCWLNVHHYRLISLPQYQVDQLGNGQPWAEQCLDPNRVKNTVASVANGPSYVMDANGVPHWIPDVESYYCYANARHYRVVTGLTQHQIDLRGNGQPWAEQCVDPARVANKVATVPGGPSYVMDAAGVPHWIPDVESYYCYVNAHQYPVVDLTQHQVDLQGNGQPWAEQCVDPARLANTVASVAGGPSYFVDGAGSPHWIPDIETYHCYVDYYHYPVVDGLVQHQIDLLGNGQPWVDRCLDPARITDHVVRVSSDGTSYLVDATGLWHWIPNGTIYNCLLQYYPLVDGLTWDQVNTLRHEGDSAACF